MTPTIGRIVHYCIGERNGELHWRPALVVREWGGTCANLQVFLDGVNDSWADCWAKSAPPGICWVTSASQGEAKGEWRWPPRS